MLGRTLALKSIACVAVKQSHSSAVRALSTTTSSFIPQTLSTPAATSSFLASSARRSYHSATVRRSGDDEDVPPLSAVLAQQIVEEDVEEEHDQELRDAQKLVEQHFTVNDKDGVALVTLTRKYDDEMIEVRFDCQNEEEDYAAMEEAEEAEESSIQGINFQVRIQRGQNLMEIECFAGNAFEVRNVNYISSEHRSVGDELYSGPKFDDLDPDLQSAFYDYLAERNIDDDLSFFVQTYSQDKEQREYIRWLKKCLEFTAK